MSEPKLISPLLDGFTVGAPIGEHHGVRCCPAIKENSERKFIVKIVSIPASQVQMDALLLTGAYKDPAAAMDYFREMGEGVMREAELLRKLSQMDGFLPYEGWQMEPITRHRLGYEVYLVSSYKRSLDKYMRRNPVTHLEALNLGLDMCVALGMCREAGSLYVDLKPSNIFISENKEYSIGDLGFLPMDALHYSALPDKYRSAYTPPELNDPLVPLNTTMDTYALGMILYQLYNDGQLPPPSVEEGAPLPSPANADYELAEILLKAIHPDPEQRWASPQEMGHALMGYMQRNAVNDIPITHHTPLELPADDVGILKRETQVFAAVMASTGAAASQRAAQAEDTDETAPSDTDAQTLLPHEMSDELSRMMSKADDLLAHETPSGVVLPKAPELPDPFAFAQEDREDMDDSAIPVDPLMETASDIAERKKKAKHFASTERKRKLKKFFSWVLTLLLLAALAFGVYWYYQNLYLQRIDSLTILGDRNQLTVSVDTDADESLLSVICSDNYGNRSTLPLVDGMAVFSGLQPNTMYRVELQISGFHKLIGQTSDIFTTDTTTSIVSFSAVTGAEDGSVVLSIVVDGAEPDWWTVYYTAEGEEKKHATFTGHSVDISGLAVGKMYTFTLDAGNQLSLSGNYEAEFRASRLILAQDLTITTSGSSDMTVKWKAPGDIVIDSWNVRCYSEDGYEEKLTVQEPEVNFTGIDSSVSYTVEVTAAGMTTPARTSITANPINITALKVDESDSGKLTVTWDYAGTEPDGGWLLMYCVDDSPLQEVIKCSDPHAVITPKIHDAKYRFTIQAADATSIFNNVQTYTTADAAVFNEYRLSADNIDFNLVKTPENPNWLYEHIGNAAFTKTFAVGDKISVVLHGNNDFYIPDAEWPVLYIIRDAHGNVLPEYIVQSKLLWGTIWRGGDYHYGEIDLPKAPDKAGDYSVSIYLNGCKLMSADFAVSEPGGIDGSGPSQNRQS